MQTGFQLFFNAYVAYDGGEAMKTVVIGSLCKDAAYCLYVLLDTTMDRQTRNNNWLCHADLFTQPVSVDLCPVNPEEYSLSNCLNGGNIFISASSNGSALPGWSSTIKGCNND